MGIALQSFSMRVFSVITISLLLLCIQEAGAQEPAANPTAMVFSNPKSYGFSMSFTPAVADAYLVLKSESPISFVPADGVAYQKGQGVAPGVKVLSVNTNYFFNVREVLENTTYHFRAFAYNGTGSNTNYRQSNPLDGSFTSPASVPGTYYSSRTTYLLTESYIKKFCAKTCCYTRNIWCWAIFRYSSYKSHIQTTFSL